MSDAPGTGPTPNSSGPNPSGPNPSRPDRDLSRTEDEPDLSHGDNERRYDPSEVNAGLWLRRLVIAFLVIAAAYAAYLVSAAFFPRWWGQQMGDLAAGDLTRGTLWGLFFGFVFTFVPLLLIGQLRRTFFSWTWRGILLVVAIVLATPNWLTLAVVVGSSDAAHAGQRIMDVDAPGFRNATAIGVGVAVLLFVVLVFTGMRSAWQKRKVRDLKGRLDEKDRATPPSKTPPSTAPPSTTQRPQRDDRPDHGGLDRG